MLNILSHSSIDLVLLDVVLPDIDGYRLAKELKAKGSPFFMISARDLPSDAILGFQSGAEEYLRKPVDNEELAIRIHHFLKKRKGRKDPLSDVIQIGDLTIDTEAEKVTVKGKVVSLTPIELRLLLRLAEYPGHFFSTRELVDFLWPDTYQSDGAQAVRVNIRRLRTKLEPEVNTPHYIINKWGAGYMLNPES